MKYNVCRYFDDHFEAVVATFEKKENAQKKADELNKPGRAYVDFLVREEVINENS